MDDPQAAEQLAPDAEHLFGRKRAVGLESVTQGEVPVEQLHHDVVRRTVAAGVVDMHEAGMRQRCRRARLVEEPGREGWVVGIARGEHLHRHVPVEPEVPRPIDARHAAMGELRLDPVPIRQRATDERRTVGHPSASARTAASSSRSATWTSARRWSGHGRDRATGLAEADAQ